MNRTHLIFLLSFFLLGTSALQGQGFLRTQGRAIVNEDGDSILLRGMGLGGWMVQEGYMLQTAGFANPQHEIRATIEALIGETATDEFYDAWLANHVRKSDIDSLKSWGFNSIRVPMHYNLFTLPIEDEPVAGQQTWLTKGFELMDSVIAWCVQNEMYVILDLHAAPGGQGYDAGISDYDDTKPSLWESQANRDKMASLWKRLAERYVDEPWVAGYDLLNEPNWDLPGGVALRNLYEQVTDSIRTVDTVHMLIIEGNWFANDFTGLTPPWDDNFVYSPHKYWSFNDVASMQFALDLRNAHNVPLYLGETGENSNVWFRDAVRLYEDLDMGWAWWPLKKIESITCPLSVTKTPEYQALLDYWSGNGPQPTAEFATDALMAIADDLKTENCVYQQDIIDAMFRQVYSDETIPYEEVHTVPGVIHASDFDMGVIGEAYFDNDAATYQVSTGNYTPWNNGWIYRNDGVDLEPSSDTVNSNGINVGFLGEGEWMKYSVDVAESGVYDMNVRVASGGSGGRLYFSANGTRVSQVSFAPPTGGWQNWTTLTLPDVILDSTDKEIRFYAGSPGFNLGSFEFVATNKVSSDVATVFMQAATLDEYSIRMNANKFFSGAPPTTPGGFEITADGNPVPITDIALDPVNPRNLIFNVDYILKSTEDIRISYTGTDVQAIDGTDLDGFTLEEVQNNLLFVHQIPTRIQAEDYNFQTGTSLEASTDNGGGQNISFLDPGDYLDYEINVPEAGTYRVDYRNASQFGNGSINLQLVDGSGSVSNVHTVNFSPTGDWQNWTTTSLNADLPKGRYLLRIRIAAGPFNLNWVEFDDNLTSILPTTRGANELKVYPNPAQAEIRLRAQLSSPQDSYLQVLNTSGQVIVSRTLPNQTEVDELISLAGQAAGLYQVVLRLADGTLYTQKVVKTEP